ncbi:MAG: hypothetical protein II453_11115 [Alphaproteobacteria bacterium]|nr:hypothetical protein [Alphaproteobacteria bacterium]
MNKKRTEYQNRYNKEHYKYWRVMLQPSEYEQIEEMRAKTGLSRREFLKALTKI